MSNIFQSLLHYTLQTTPLETLNFNDTIQSKVDDEVVIWTAENENRPFPDDHYVTVTGPSFDYEIHYSIHICISDFVMGQICEIYRATMTPNNIWSLEHTR